MAVGRSLTNSCEKQRSEKQRRKGKIYPFECRIPNHSKPSSAINAKKQRKTIEWERLRDLFKKIRDTKGTFHAKMGSIKDRNGRDLTEAEDIKKGWQKYTELYKKDLHNPDNHDGVITHLQPDILECEVKWALGSITMNKASGGDGILVELFQILKDDALKMML